MPNRYLPEIEDDCERDHEGVRRLSVMTKMFGFGPVSFLRDGPGMVFDYMIRVKDFHTGSFMLQDEYFVTEDLDEMHEFITSFLEERQSEDAEADFKARDEV